MYSSHCLQLAALALLFVTSASAAAFRPTATKRAVATPSLATDTTTTEPDGYQTQVYTTYFLTTGTDGPPNSEGITRVDSSTIATVTEIRPIITDLASYTAYWVTDISTILEIYMTGYTGGVTTTSYHDGGEA